MRSLKTEPPRPYRKRARADKQAETHRALAEAAYALHTTVGPAKTTVSAIAERAGVQRLTVYRHFPDQEAIFAACTAHAFAKDAPPVPETWRPIANPRARLATALHELYGYYRRNRQLLANLYRDAELPVVADALTRRASLLQQAVAILAEGWPADPATEDRLRRAAIGHALDFFAWLSLTETEGLTDEEAIDLMTGLVTKTGAK
jgi:AcrR family transcriptional regulator